MTEIVFLGAASTVFARNPLGNILSHEELADSVVPRRPYWQHPPWRPWLLCTHRFQVLPEAESLALNARSGVPGGIGGWPATLAISETQQLAHRRDRKSTSETRMALKRCGFVRSYPRKAVVLCTS